MENDDLGRQPKYPPVWFILILVVVAMPGLTAPLLSAALPAGSMELSAMFKLYPLYALAAAWFACICYRQRTTVAWILVALLLLSDLALFSTLRLTT